MSTPLSVNVRYFASLAEELGRREEQITVGCEATVADVWRVANGDRPLPANVLSAVNHDYVDRAHQVAAGDEVAVFPPVTGG